jgi:hypothetical protein
VVTQGCTGQQVLLIDLEDAIEALHRQDDAAAYRHRAPGVAGAGAADDEREALCVAETRNGRDLRRCCRHDDHVGGMPALQRVDAVAAPRVDIGQDVRASDDLRERLDERGIHCCVVVPGRPRGASRCLHERWGRSGHPIVPRDRLYTATRPRSRLRTNA